MALFRDGVKIGNKDIFLEAILIMKTDKCIDKVSVIFYVALAPLTPSRLAQ